LIFELSISVVRGWSLQAQTFGLNIARLCEWRLIVSLNKFNRQMASSITISRPDLTRLRASPSRIEFITGQLRPGRAT
jgi:hypothetical protein